MKEAIASLLERYDDRALRRSRVIPWSSPVPSFGDPTRARVATLGLNPSNREFKDVAGRELDEHHRRFHTLRSLGISRWSEVREDHACRIVESCSTYFNRRPYDGWFKKLDFVISGTRASYYDKKSSACHLDLIPYATSCKWTELRRKERASLLAHAGDTLALLLQKSVIRVLILNGASVISHFEALADARLTRVRVDSWTLPRRGSAVAGVGYKGVIRRLAGAELARDVLVLGFNHNIQSSFGVTRAVVESIRSWIGRHARTALR